MERLRGGGHVCAVKNCKGSSSKTKISFFTFPKDQERAQIWAVACGRYDLSDKAERLHKGYRLCAGHFETRHFLNDLRNRLQPKAVPTIFPTDEYTSSAPSDHKYVVCHIPSTGSGHETISTDVAHDPFSGPQSTNLDIDNRCVVEQDTCNGSKLTGFIETDVGSNLVLKREGYNTFSTVQKDNNSDRQNVNFESYLKADQNKDITKSENSHRVNNISEIGPVKALPNSIFNHNRLISVTKLSFEGLNEFIGILTTSDVEVLQFSRSSLQTIKQKRIILIGSTFKCNLCSVYFITKARNDNHIQMHKRLEQRKAKRDKLKKQRLQKLEEEKKNRTPNARMNPYRRKRSKYILDLECKTCLKKCSTRDDLAFHVKIHPPFVCEKCGKGFASSCQLGSHKTAHNDPNSFLCEVCGKGCKTRNQLRAHKSVHENNSVLCTRCPKVFNTEFKVRRHLKNTHGEGLTNVWPCKECNKIFKLRSSLKYHVRHIHLRENQYTCVVCGQGFFRSDYLKRHERRHTIYGDEAIKKRKPGSYQCQICTKVLKSMANLKLHIRSHGTLSRFSCKYCSMTFKVKNHRNRHEKLHEHSELRFRCGICWKRLESQKELDQHYLTHNNLKKYECDSCEQSFARKHLLDDHIVNSHTENGDAEEEMRTLLAAGLGNLK